MKIKLKLKVTEENIKNARLSKDYNYRSCPVALALLDKGFRHVGVGSGVAGGYFGSVWFGTSLTKKAKDFVRKFDDKQEVKPFETVLKFREHV